MGKIRDVKEICQHNTCVGQTDDGLKYRRSLVEI